MAMSIDDLYHTQATQGSFSRRSKWSGSRCRALGYRLTLPLDTGGPVNWIKVRSGTRNQTCQAEGRRAFGSYWIRRKVQCRAGGGRVQLGLLALPALLGALDRPGLPDRPVRLARFAARGRDGIYAARWDA